MLSREPAVVVYDTNRDALARRASALRAAVPGVTTYATSSRTAVLLLAETAAPGTLVLVDLFDTDRVSVDRPGVRLIRRLVRSLSTANVRPVAWSAQAGPDVFRSVQGAGAHGFVVASLDAEEEARQLARAAAGERVWPPAAEEASARAHAAWQTWFQDSFGMAWEPWIEPVLVRLASGRERRAVVSELVELGVAKSATHAAARMREISSAIVGEHRNSGAEVAAGASNVLSQIATHRALVESPEMAVSLDHGVRAVQTQPSLVRAAGLTGDEATEIVEIDALIRAQRLAQPARPGAPASDQVLHERRWAASRRAVAAGAGREQMDDVITGTLARLDEALAAVRDARQDELYFPEGRAAAALALLRPADRVLIDELDGGEDGRVRWRGHTVAELAIATELDPVALHDFSSAVDAVLVERGA